MGSGAEIQEELDSAQEKIWEKILHDGQIRKPGHEGSIGLWQHQEPPRATPVPRTSRKGAVH